MHCRGGEYRLVSVARINSAYVLSEVESCMNPVMLDYQLCCRRGYQIPCHPPHYQTGPKAQCAGTSQQLLKAFKSPTIPLFTPVLCLSQHIAISASRSLAISLRTHISEPILAENRCACCVKFRNTIYISMYE